jgi:hypothetical protein
MRWLCSWQPQLRRKPKPAKQHSIDHKRHTAPNGYLGRKPLLAWGL